MLILQYLAALILSLSAQASSWKHELLGPKILTDEIVLSTYKNEIAPDIHNGVTITNYLKEFDINVQKSHKGCFIPQIDKWLVESTIYIRSKDDKSIIKGRPRWQKISDFECINKNGFFNTWDGTYQHELEHYKVRDFELKKFWNNLETQLATTCESSQEAAKTKILLEIESFLKLINKIDTEENPRKVENRFYQKQFEKQTGKKCD